MKLEIFIDPKTEEERVEVYARERNSLINRIEEICGENAVELIGYDERGAVRFEPQEVVCFLSEGGATVARLRGGTVEVRLRLYQLEAALGSDFIRINKSCIANISHISRFDVTFMGALAVVFKDGYRDFVSRRQLKAVKERLGLK